MNKSKPLPECQECGMPVEAHEYHPYAACLMFKACRDSDVVRANLDAVLNRRAAPASVSEGLNKAAEVLRVLSTLPDDGDGSDMPEPIV